LKIGKQEIFINFVQSIITKTQIMNQLYKLSLAVVLGGFSLQANAQRYLTEVFTDAQITIQNDVQYGQNISIQNTILGALSNPPQQVAPDTLPLLMDVYMPALSADNVTERPLVVYASTGNFLPAGINGSPTGNRKDSSAVNMAKQFAKRGYVCAVVDYRLGWNPFSTDQIVRTGTILNAAYKGQQDTKAAVRYFRNDKATTNNYMIDPTRVVLFGEGTGGYVMMAHAFLDQPWKIGRLPGLGDNKFLRTEAPDSSVIDTNRVGNFDGTNDIPMNLIPFVLSGGDFLKVTGNVANNPGYSSEANIVINMGGALGDTSWLDAGQIPMIGIHAVRDPNAPYQIGDVIVPTTGDVVIPFASGAGFNLERANSYGNNSSFANRIYPDAITAAVEARYGQTIPFAGSTIAVGTGKGLLPFILPENATYSLNHGSPWQFWNSAQATANYPVTIAPGVTITTHQASAASNPAMATSNEVGRSTALTYIDTVQRYINPRIVCALNLAECDLFDGVGINELNSSNSMVSAFPNPSNGNVTIRSNVGSGQLNSIHMFDVTGRQVVAQSGLNTASYQINRNDLPSGIYLVQYVTENGRGTIKLIFE
jgi:hypothetical protein